MTWIGRTPIHQAVNKLAADTLIIVRPRHGLQIAPIERAGGRDEGGRLFPDSRHLLLQAPVGPNVPERQSEQNGPEASRNVERSPFERTAAMVMDADADEERQANGQAQRDASWAECANEPARKRNQEHQGCGDPAILAST